MILEATVDGRCVRVEVRQSEGGFAVTLAGQPAQHVDYAPTGRHCASLLIDGRSHEVGLLPREGGFSVLLAGRTLEVQLQDAGRAGAGPARKPAHGPAAVQAPMPGRIVKVLVEVGQDAALGQGLVVMEAMKMENELRAPRAGRVREVRVSEGQAVETGAMLVVLD